MKKAIHRYKYMYAFSLQANIGWLDLDLSLVYLTLKFMLARSFFSFGKLCYDFPNHLEQKIYYSVKDSWLKFCIDE